MVSTEEERIPACERERMVMERGTPAAVAALVNPVEEREMVKKGNK
ncbi:hypothetical protein A2U01_0039350, partial [Trifolium medium]|nr:hypothetical protein [Trifolium medium]